jgi:hypothetical protein
MEKVTTEAKDPFRWRITMPRYTVFMRDEQQVIVTARDEDEAIEKAMDSAIPDWEVTDIEEDLDEH